MVALRASKIKNNFFNKILNMIITIMIAKLIMTLRVAMIIKISAVMMIKTILRIMAKKMQLVTLSASK